MVDKRLQKMLLRLLTIIQKGLQNVKRAWSKLMHASGVCYFCECQFIICGRKKKKKANITGMWNIQERVSESLASRNFMFLEK